MTRRFGAAGLCLTSLFVFATPAMAQQSRCADCHFSRPEAPAPDHLADWDRSDHSRNNVGCEECHGGDASTFEPFLAHRGILNSTNPASPVNRRNLSTRVSDQPRRAQLDEAYQQAEVPLIQAVQAGHQFVYDDLKERLSVARQRIEALLGQLANPKP